MKLIITHIDLVHLIVESNTTTTFESVSENVDRLNKTTSTPVSTNSKEQIQTTTDHKVPSTTDFKSNKDIYVQKYNTTTRADAKSIKVPTTTGEKGVFVPTIEKDDTNSNQDSQVLTTTLLGVASTPSSKSSRCFILREFGTWDFFYKYTREEVRQVLCICRKICVPPPPASKPPDSNSTDGSSDDGDVKIKEEDRMSFIVLTTIYSILFTLGVVGNILTIVGLLFWMKSRSATFLLILSLAASDLLVVMVCLPLKEMEFFRISNVLDGMVCKAVYYLKDFSLACSVLTLTVISFERFYAICYPLNAQFRCSVKRAMVLILIIWLASALLASPTIFAMKSYISSWTNSNLCRSNFDYPIHTKLYFIYYLLILYCIPLMVMVYTYGKSALTLWKSAQIVQNMQGDNKRSKPSQPESSGYDLSCSESHTNDDSHDKDKDKDNENVANAIDKRKQVLRMLLSLLVVFAVCWGPTLIIHALLAFGYPIYQHYITRLTADTLAFFNSCLNPYLFMSMSTQFRRTVRRKLCCESKLDKPTKYWSTLKYSESSTRVSTVSVKY
ncbi:hypothetical protein LOTGIDRAFT_152277 [Lottia gigantea]|uniref:G-protein coupled receptors family 1 profile domain-containing protein n=1 Tax=Lottia gigantea TaxID=225164 RepID=V4BCL7_LOTGI|nr:hypothetical protein LOTGIDRAFT_152277 [Lottia gigantea]ESP05426.1 hypothetical protein LOTGIDRAFT_152277 [Lottia gigantea]